MVVAQHVVMMSGPVYNQGADFMRRAKKKLDEMNISCLPVVDDEKKLQGIITPVLSLLEMHWQNF